MQKKNRIRQTAKLLAWALFTTCFLCGCTKKEDLLILTDQTAAKEAGSEEPGGMMSASSMQEQDAAETAAMRVQMKPAEETAAQVKSVDETAAQGGLLYVHVCGAVKSPGVYELPAGCRVYEAVQAAGGFSKDADQNYVNQAQILPDGVKLVIPTKEEAAAAEGSEAEDGGRPDAGGGAVREKSKAAWQIGVVGGENASGSEAAGRTDTESAERADGRININTATLQELCAIPGVGETRAAAIVSYRESHGDFTKPEDIMKVNGIKEGMYEKIKDSISVDRR